MKKIVLIVSIVFIGFILTILFLLQSENITGIKDELGNGVIKQSPKSEFLKGEKIRIMFDAKENYLGQFQFRFYNYNRINKDQVIFRMKENGDKVWSYENVYKTDQFQPNKLFPFGFPIIPNSKGKAYVVEIESVSGKPEDAVTVSTMEPISAVIYQYPKKELLTNPQILIEFIKNKIIYTNYDLDFFVAVGKYITLLLTSLILIYLFMTGFVMKRKFNLKISGMNIISLGIFCVFINVMLLYIDKEELSRNTAIVGYFFLVIGTLLLVIEERQSITQDNDNGEKTKKKERKNK